MCSPVSPIVANLHMEEVEGKALGFFRGTQPSHCFRYVDDTWVKIKTHEVERFTDHTNSGEQHFKFTQGVECPTTFFSGLCGNCWTETSQLKSTKNQPTQTSTSALTPTTHCNTISGVIRTLHDRLNNIPTMSEGKDKEHQHVRNSLGTCAQVALPKIHQREQGQGAKKYQEQPRQQKEEHCHPLCWSTF